MVEVLASMALIGTLLVFILTANADQSRNLSSARQKINAIGAADRLVATWISRPEGIPHLASGNCDTKGLRWEIGPSSQASSIPETEIVDLKILPIQTGGRSVKNDTVFVTLSLLREVLDEE